MASDRDAIDRVLAEQKLLTAILASDIATGGGNASVLRMIIFRAERMVKYARCDGCPDIIIRNELQMLREAIEKWEAGSKGRASGRKV